MDLRELAIGNYVALFGETVRVAPVDYVQETFALGAKPIKITDEWLLKLGFENTDFNEWHKYPITVRANRIIRYGHIKSTRGIANIEYIHQLQNLYFALTGQELELKQTTEA